MSYNYGGSYGHQQQQQQQPHGGHHQQQGGYGGGYGGYGAPPPGGGIGGFGAPVGPPPGADPELWKWFNSVDDDRSGHINPVELQKALINGDWSPFDLDTVKLLMSLFDTDRSGTIGFNEFAGLWQYIKDWQNVFRHFDADRSGTIDGKELTNAMEKFGYHLTSNIITLLEKKYDVKAGVTGQKGITFDRFVRCCVVVKTLTESFKKMDSKNTGWVQMNYDTFMTTVLQLP